MPIVITSSLLQSAGRSNTRTTFTSSSLAPLTTASMNARRTVPASGRSVESWRQWRLTTTRSSRSAVRPGRALAPYFSRDRPATEMRPAVGRRLARTPTGQPPARTRTAPFPRVPAPRTMAVRTPAHCRARGFVCLPRAATASVRRWRAAPTLFATSHCVQCRPPDYPAPTHRGHATGLAMPGRWPQRPTARLHHRRNHRR